MPCWVHEGYQCLLAASGGVGRRSAGVIGNPLSSSHSRNGESLRTPSFRNRSLDRPAKEAG